MENVEILIAIAWFASLVGVGIYMETTAYQKGFKAGKGELRSDLEGLVRRW